MQHDLDLMVWGAAFDEKLVSVRRTQGQRIDHQSISGCELQFPKSVHFLIPGKRNLRWIEGAVLRRSRKVEHARILADDANKKAIDLRSVGLVDFTRQPCLVLGR